MIKKMTISIEVSGETSEECNIALIDAMDDIQNEIQWYPKGFNSTGNLDKGIEEIHWDYQIKTIE